MTRIILLELFLFLLPFLLFAGWRYVVHDARGGEVMSDAPVVVLIALGAALFVGGLFYLASYDYEGTQGRYRPPVYRDGKIIPGHFDEDPAGPGGK